MVMNPPAAHHAVSARTGHSFPALRWFVGIVMVCTALIALLILGVTSYFRLSADTGALLSGVTKASGLELRRVVALNVGEATFTLARAGLSFARLPEEARAALRSVRACEVGVYHSLTRGDNGASEDRPGMLERADAAMIRRGWERIVGVLDGDDLVAVYAPAAMDSPQSVRFCVVVFDGSELVVAGIKGDLRPVFEIAFNQAKLHAPAGILAKR